MQDEFEKLTGKLYPKVYDKRVRGFLTERYDADADRIWQEIKKKYLEYYRDLPDLGGKDNGHASAIYGGLLVFSLYACLPDQPPAEELQDFVQTMFMRPFMILGKVIDLNRRADMRLINTVFAHAGKRDRKDILKYPAGFANVTEPYDAEKCISRYSFTQCPNAEFARAHDLLHVLPLLCNSDFYGIEQIHGRLIRCSTCGNGTICDYCVVGSDHSLAKEYETIRDENGYLVSRRKQ